MTKRYTELTAAGALSGAETVSLVQGASRRTTAQAIANLAPAGALFTPSTNGTVPASGGGTTSFLRADGSWASPGGSGAPGGADSQIQFNDSAAFGGNAGLTYNKTTRVQFLTSGVFSTPGRDDGTRGGGLRINLKNPNADNTSSYSVAVELSVDVDSSGTDIGFTNEQALTVGMTASHGSAVFNPTTQSKKTFLPLNLTAVYTASGQKNLYNQRIDSYGMSDTSVGQQFVTFAGGPVSGDEGQGFNLVCGLSQQTNVVVKTISSVTRSAVAAGITVTQPITGSRTAQTVNVSATTGISVNDWLVVQQGLANQDNNEEAVLVTAIGPGTITAVFYCNHPNGSTLTAALVLGTGGDTNQCGQDRVLVNLSGASYSTGTVSSIAGGQFNGTGTAWANNIVGGNALNIGAITLAADDYTGGPFDAGANRLRSWFQIEVITSPTALGMFSYSVAGSRGYNGKGPGAGTYTIRPAVRILRVIPGIALICETTPSTWSVGHSVECVICPYADVTGRQDHIAAYTSGGTYRTWYDVVNTGARTFGNGLVFRSALPIGGGSGADAIAWDTVFDLTSINRGIVIRGAQKVAAQMPLNILSDDGNSWGEVSWNDRNAGPGMRGNNTNQGMDLALIAGGVGTFVGDSGTLSAIKAGTGPNADANLSALSWGGYLHIHSNNSGARPFARFAGGSTNVTWSTAGTVDIIYNNSLGGQFGNLLLGSGFDFTLNDPTGAFGPAGIVYTLFEMGTSGVGVGFQGAAAISNVTNKPSFPFYQFASEWNGAAARNGFTGIQTTVASGVNNAPVTWNVVTNPGTIDPGNEYALTRPSTPLSVRQDGLLNFGLRQDAGGINKTITLDPSPVTAARTYTMIDTNGTISLADKARVASDFSKTSDTALANVTGLTVNVRAGQTYSFEAEISFTCAAAGGVQAAISGTCSATDIIYDGWIVDSGANGIKGNTQATALGTAVASAVTTGTAGHITIKGTITVNAAGTLTVQFAQNTSNGTASVAKRGSYFIVHDMV